MTTRLHALCFDANDPRRLAAFWGTLLGWQTNIIRDGAELVPSDDTGFRLHFLPSPAPKLGQNLMHFDLTSNLRPQAETVEAALGLGARHIDVGQKPEEGHVVLADPEGNEFCVVEEGNKFLADCGAIGAISGDGLAATGYFWSEALGWPLVWDQDEETAIRSPEGGPKITWGGPPLMPKSGKNRLHFDVVPDGDQRAEVDRLIGLGAQQLDLGDADQVVMTDPGGNEFCVLTP